MYDTKEIQLQIGGSDQFGNIITGMDAINYITQNHYDPLKRKRLEPEFLNKPMGFTTPLLTTAAGEKFGKSAGNAVWLEKEMTSSFDLYQVQTCLTFCHMHVSTDRNLVLPSNRRHRHRAVPQALHIHS